MRLFPLLMAAALPFTRLTAQERRFSSSDAADAAERLTGRRAHMDQDIRHIAGGRLEGPALTVQLVRDDNASLVDEGLKAFKVFEEAPPGAVIVACLDGDKDYAPFGPTFVTIATNKHLNGIVTNGAMRGVADLRQIGVPVFSRGTVSGSAGSHYRLASINSRVECGSIHVDPGDLIVGDDDGIAVIPRDSIAAGRTLAQRLRDDKEEMLPLIQKYGSYLKAVQEIRAKHSPKPTP